MGSASSLVAMVAAVTATAVAVLLLVPARLAHSAATLPGGFVESLVVDGLVNPTSMTLAPGGRIFVAEQDGRLRVIQNGTLLARPLATFRVDPRGERGLLGVALDPAFARNGLIYVYFTTRSRPIHNRVVRLRADGNREAPGNRRVLLRLNNLSTARNHNGGALRFGRDGRLYVAVGENARSQSAQTLRNLLGKMLRINRDGSIPRDNPFFRNRRVTGKNKAIWVGACAIPSASLSSPAPAGSLSTTWGRSDGRRSTAARRGRTTGGPPSKDPRRTAATNRPSSPTGTATREGPVAP